MSAGKRDAVPQAWLAAMIKELLEQKYGQGRVPGVRKISADISAANDGATISHGHVHNILIGEAENLTDRTRGLLAKFFGKHPSYFYPPADSADPDPDSVQALVARFATFDAAQVAAIKQAIEIVTARVERDQR